MNNIIVTDEKARDKLLQKGCRHIETRYGVNGESVWVLNPCGLSFDINEDWAQGVAWFDSKLSLTF